jgi:hypothetical protein
MTKKYITVLAVIEVCEPVHGRSEEQLLEDAGVLFGNGWPVVSDDSRTASTLIAKLHFASVVHGVSDAAVKQGCEVED